MGGGVGSGAAPVRRRDARRNRELLVTAAHEVFTEQGLEAPLDVIARRAGVGNATLYRHFPSRAALIDAVFHDQLAGTMAVGDRSVDTYVARLRLKLEDASPGWAYIHTHFGIGYRFEPRPVAEAAQPQRLPTRIRPAPSLVQGGG